MDEKTYQFTRRNEEKKFIFQEKIFFSPSPLCLPLLSKMYIYLFFTSLSSGSNCCRENQLKQFRIFVLINVTIIFCVEKKNRLRWAEELKWSRKIKYYFIQHSHWKWQNIRTHSTTYHYVSVALRNAKKKISCSKWYVDIVIYYEKKNIFSSMMCQCYQLQISIIFYKKNFFVYTL